MFRRKSRFSREFESNQAEVRANWDSMLAEAREKGTLAPEFDSAALGAFVTPEHPELDSFVGGHIVTPEELPETQPARTFAADSAANLVETSPVASPHKIPEVATPQNSIDELGFDKLSLDELRQIYVSQSSAAISAGAARGEEGSLAATAYLNDIENAFLARLSEETSITDATNAQTEAISVESPEPRAQSATVDAGVRLPANKGGSAFSDRLQPVESIIETATSASTPESTIAPEAEQPIDFEQIEELRETIDVVDDELNRSSVADLYSELGAILHGLDDSPLEGTPKSSPVVGQPAIAHNYRATTIDSTPVSLGLLNNIDLPPNTVTAEPLSPKRETHSGPTIQEFEAARRSTSYEPAVRGNDGSLLAPPQMTSASIVPSPVFDVPHPTPSTKSPLLRKANRWLTQKLETRNNRKSNQVTEQRVRLADKVAAKPGLRWLIKPDTIPQANQQQVAVAEQRVRLADKVAAKPGLRWLTKEVATSAKDPRAA